MSRIKTTMEKHTINWLKKKSEKNQLDFTISIQRKEVWDLEHKSNLIGAILLGIPLESLLFEEEGDKDGYKVLDGKQRSTTILSYLRDEFAISDKCKIAEIGDFEIIGKKFSDLDEDLQETILEFELSISTMRPLSEDDRELVFFMRNQAVALTNIELTRVLLGSSSMKVVEDLAKHNFISKTAVGSETNRKKCIDQQVVIECLLVDSEHELGFSSKDLKKYAEILKADGISDEAKDKIIKTFDYLDKVFAEKSKLLKKVHIPMIYKVAQVAIENEIATNVFNKWVEKFFEFLKNNPENEYQYAVSNSSAQLSQVKKRTEFMMADFDKNVINFSIDI